MTPAAMPLADWTPAETCCDCEYADIPRCDECGEEFETDLMLVDGLCSRCDPMTPAEVCADCERCTDDLDERDLCPDCRSRSRSGKEAVD